jgi:uncharacterized protein (DUF488 family)
MIEALSQHMQHLKEAIDARQAVPMFFCSERDYRQCHRLGVAEFATQQVWQGDTIIHL